MAVLSRTAMDQRKAVMVNGKAEMANGMGHGPGAMGNGGMIVREKGATDDAGRISWTGDDGRRNGHAAGRGGFSAAGLEPQPRARRGVPAARRHTRVLPPR